MALCRDVARADLRFVKECKAFRREMERRVGALAGSSDLPDDGTPALVSSVGMGVSTEILPVPNQI
jgi:hypothetical protein